MADEIDVNAENLLVEQALKTQLGNNYANLVSSLTNAPKDIKNLEQQKTSYNLYYPLNLQDTTVNASSFNHAVSFVVYRQLRSEFGDPFAGGNRSSLARGFENRQFPINGAGFGISTGIRAVSTLPRLADRPVELLVLGLAAGTSGGVISNVSPGYGLSGRLRKTEQIITLYTPDTMTLQETHQYEQISLTSAAGMAGLLSFGSEGYGGNATEIAAEFASRTGIIGPRATEAALAGIGYAVNPMLELIFNGTQQRKFNFQFRFAPRNKKEAEAAINIIKAFRFHAAAEYDTGKASSRYFIPPSMFEIQFKQKVNGNLSDNTYLPRTAPCVLTSVDTNYAAGGNYATFEDGIPAEMTLDLAFTESIVLIKEDIRNGY